MPNSYPHDGIFNPHLTTIKDSYTLFAQTCLSENIFTALTLKVLKFWTLEKLEQLS